MDQVSKELPHDILAEKAFIGCLLVDNKSFDNVTDLNINETDFYHPQYGVIFKGIKELAVESKPFDLVSICAKLTDMGKIEAVGGQSAVLQIIEDTASSANIYHYGKIIKNKAVLRGIVRTSMRITEQGLNFVGDVEEFIDDVESSFFNLANETRTNFVITLKESLKENLRRLEEGKREAGEILGLTTGFGALDKRLLGMQPGQMIIIAARPGMGKTAFVLNLAINSIKQSNLPVMLYSYEMLAPELSGRILSSEANIDSRKIRTNDYTDSDLRNLGYAVQELSKLPIYINDSGATTLLDIKSQARKVSTEQGLGMIVIDYLQLMQPHVRKSSREQEIAEISRGIKELAKELKCPIIALSQLNRSATSRTDRRPQLQDLRESGSIEQDADVVMLIHREDYYDENTPEKGVAEIIIAKNRAGEPGTVKLAWIAAQTKFAELQFDPGPQNG
ncbi:MAG: replicative DNA helicase [Bacteriovoracaceae bacterium]|jgi:replicative DNA helicase|nr:replicative DNA helicase [Halobacteriovoraceae bacterium]MAX67675.1 replicative DNA helicase [Halobacteriovoraceae bacterium]MDP7320302.1 replicative DNA helicase [Bacteriovoracaceae bacterium]